MSLLIYTSITETRSQAWIMRAAREGFMSVWYNCGGRFVTVPKGLYVMSSSRQCLPFQVLLYLWFRAHPADQCLSAWERNFGMKTHQVITGTTTINYRCLCLALMLLCLGTHQEVTVSSRQDEGEPQLSTRITSMLNCDQKCSSAYHLTGIMHFSQETIHNNCFGETLAASGSEHSVRSKSPALFL